VQTVGSVQTEIIICIRIFFGLSNYELNQTFKNINRINRKLNKAKKLVYLVKPKLYYLKRNKNIKSYKN
jgi:hypothetical protein